MAGNRQYHKYAWGCKGNFDAVEPNKCSCGLSSRALAANELHKTVMNVHRTRFTKDSRPHYHNTAEGKPAPLEIYYVVEGNKNAHIYLSWCAIPALRGTVVYVDPGVVHGGDGKFVSFTCGHPAFSEAVNQEVRTDDESNATIVGSKTNILEPNKYEGEAVYLTARAPAVVFPRQYRTHGSNLIVTPSESGLVCAAAKHDQLNPDGFRNAALTYVMVLDGEGEVRVVKERSSTVEVGESDILLINPGCTFHIDPSQNLSTVILIAQPKKSSLVTIDDLVNNN